MTALKSLMVSAILFLATTAYGAAGSSSWPGPSLTVLVGVVIVVFVLIRWRSKP